MLISKAYAQALEAGTTAATSAAIAAPTATEAFLWNMGMVAVLVVLFYVLLIRPQQKRFREHTEMLAALKKGDEVIAGGGLIGTVDKIVDGKDEAVVDLGNGVKVTVVRSTLQSKNPPQLKPANDTKTDAKKKA